MDSLFLVGLQGALSWVNLGYALAGCLIGTLVGVLPGLGPAATMAILLPATTYLPPTGSIIALAGIYYGSMYGGSTTAILLNIPGEAASTVTCLDGFPMTQQGRAGQALSIAAIGSFIAGIGGTLMLALFAPALAELAYQFGPAEYFGLIAFALVSLIGLSSESLFRGVAAGAAGLWLASFGSDPLSGTARMTFGFIEMTKGFDLIPVLVGLFGIAEVLVSYAEKREQIYKGKLGSVWSMLPRGAELIRGLAASVRGAFSGFILGLLPGMLPALTAWVAYDIEKKISRHPQKFGRGAIEGVAAPESANNATAMAGFVPLMAIGLPTSPVLAILLGAFLLNGLQPGPNLFVQNGAFVWTVIASMLIANVMLLVLNLPLVKFWAALSLVPYKVLGPFVIAISLVSAYAARNTLFDVFVAIAFGVLGYVMRSLKWSIIPFVLGFMLGPTLEGSLRQALAISGGSPAIFFDRPICLGLLLASLGIIVASSALKRRSAIASRLILEGGSET